MKRKWQRAPQRQSIECASRHILFWYAIYTPVLYMDSNSFAPSYRFCATPSIIKRNRPNIRFMSWLSYLPVLSCLAISSQRLPSFRCNASTICSSSGSHGHFRSLGLRLLVHLLKERLSLLTGRFKNLISANNTHLSLHRFAILPGKWDAISDHLLPNLFTNSSNFASS